MSTEREALAEVIRAIDGPATIGGLEVADAILAAGWLSPAGVRTAQAEALREAADEEMARNGATLVLERLLKRADALAPTAEPDGIAAGHSGCMFPGNGRHIPGRQCTAEPAEVELGRAYRSGESFTITHSEDIDVMGDGAQFPGDTGPEREWPRR